MVLRQDVGSLTTFYWNTGWREAAIQDRTTISEDRTKADVVYRVVEGDRTFFGKTIIRGNAVTRISRIERQIAWKEGEPFSQAKIAETQQSLARTGAFRTIELRPQPVDPESQERNVDLQIAEARRISLLYGFGYQNVTGATENRNDVFGIVGATYRNLFVDADRFAGAAVRADLGPRPRLRELGAVPLQHQRPADAVVPPRARADPGIDIDRPAASSSRSGSSGSTARRAPLRVPADAPRNPEDFVDDRAEKFPS